MHVIYVILPLSETLTEWVMRVLYVILTLSEKFGRGSNACNICNICNIDIE